MDENENEIEDAKYIFTPFIPFFLLFQKVLNRLLDLSKEIKSLKYLVCIQKIFSLRNTIFALEFLSRKDSKAKKKLYTNYLKQRLKSHFAFTASTASGIINNRFLIEEYLESHLFFNYCQDLKILTLH